MRGSRFATRARRSSLSIRAVLAAGAPELLPSQPDEAPESVHFVGDDEAPGQGRFRRIEVVIENNPELQRLSRCTPWDGVVQEPTTWAELPPAAEDTPPRAKHKKAKTANKTIQKPKPKPPKRRRASARKAPADAVDSRPPPSVHTVVSDWLESVGPSGETHGQPSYDDPVPGHVTTPAPEMAPAQNAHGFPQAAYEAPSVPPDTANTTAAQDRARDLAYIAEYPYGGYQRLNQDAESVGKHDPDADSDADPLLAPFGEAMHRAFNPPPLQPPSDYVPWTGAPDDVLDDLDYDAPPAS